MSVLSDLTNILMKTKCLFPIEVLEHPRHQVINVRFMRHWVDLFRRKSNRYILKLVPERKKNNLFCKYSTLYLQEYIPSYADPIDETLFIVNLQNDEGIVIVLDDDKRTPEGYPKLKISSQQMDLLIDFLKNSNKGGK